MRDSHISDYYVTPIYEIENFLREFAKRIPINWNDKYIVDCCAGGNPEVSDKCGIKEVFHPMSYPEAIRNVFGQCNIDTYDIRNDSFAKYKGDYLKFSLHSQPDIIISNPPFKLAAQIIKKALHDVSDDGLVIMLLRLNFFGSEERKSFFNEFMPEWSFVHHKRIGFTDRKDKNGYVLFNKEGMPKSGGTDSIEYQHAIFRKGYYPEYTKLVLI